MLGEIGKFWGGVIGAIGGASAAMVAEVLDIPIEAVKEAMRAGCETYEEVREFCRGE